MTAVEPDGGARERPMTRPSVVETEAAPAPASLPSSQTGVAPRAPRPVAPPAPAYDLEAFSAAGRIVCGCIAAVFAAGVYLTPNLTSLFWSRAIFALGVYVFGQIAVFGRFGRRPAAP